MVYFIPWSIPLMHFSVNFSKRCYSLLFMALFGSCYIVLSCESENTKAHSYQLFYYYTVEMVIINLDLISFHFFKITIASCPQIPNIWVSILSK